MTRLEAAIARARGAAVDRAAAERYVGELDRWARPAPSRWAPWLAAGLAAAALAVVIGVVAVRDRAAAPVAVRVGDQVALVAAPRTAYRVLRADAGATEIVVERGAVTARLWHGAHAHRLVLSGGGVTALATGTIYSLEVGPGGVQVHVDEGTVEVRAADGVHRVPAGGSWPAARARPPAGASVLMAMTAPEATGAGSDADRAADRDANGADSVASAADRDANGADSDARFAGSAADRDARGAGSGSEDDARAAGSAVRAASNHASAAGNHAPAGAAAPRATAGPARVSAAASTGAAADVAAGGRPAADRAPPTIKDRWRAARLLRAQGRFADALAACLAIGDARDPTWSPIALVEAIRIALGPLADPERAITLADRVMRDWPRDALAAEARALRCRASTQLGRAGACAASAP